MVEPSYGYSAALPPLSASRASDGGTLYASANELSSAARSLQMSQGAMSGQTQSINNMAQMQMQQMQMMGQMIQNLNFSISQLASAMGQQASSTRMASMIPPPPPMMSGYSGGSPGGGFGDMMSGGLGAVGGAMFGAGRMAAQGVGMMGRAAGYVGGAMAAPFFGATYQGPGVGQWQGTVGNAGFARSAVMASGLGFPVGGYNGIGRSGFGMTEAAGDRAGFKAGEMLIGGMGGLASFGGQFGATMGPLGGGLASMLGGGIGGMIGEKIGGRTGGGIGSVLGTAAGGAMMGGPLGAAAAVAGLAASKAVEMTVGRITEQIGEARGNGEMYGRNAFRFTPASGSRRVSQTDRASFGLGMQRTGSEDLSLSNRDMQEIFAGGVENDMFRGVSNAQQAQQRLRQLKDSVKSISQALGTGIRETMDVMGQMQGMGISPSAMTSTMLTGGSVQGLTRNEALSGQMAFMNRFQGSGLQGQGLMDLAGSSQALGQTAMRMGLLSSEKIAGLGGRNGVQNVMGNVTMALAQSGLGQMNLAAGMRGGVGGVGGNAMSALGQAGGNGTAANLVSFAANQGSMLRDAIKDPNFRINMLEQVSSIADQFKGMGTKKDRMKLALKSLGVEGNEAGAFLDMMQAEPMAQAERMAETTRSLEEMRANQLAENLNPVNRVGRAFNRAVNPIVEGGAMLGARVGDATNNTLLAARNKIFGIDAPVSSRRSDVTMDAVLSERASRSGGVAKNADVLNSNPDRELVKNAKSQVDALFDDEDIRTLRETDDADEKKSAAERLVARLAADMGSSDNETKKAIAMALGEKTGQDVSGMLFGAGIATNEDVKKVNDLNAGLRSALTSTGDKATMGGIGAWAGTAVGALLAPLTGGLSIGAGMYLGGAAGALFAGQQFSDDAINQLGRSSSAASLLKAKQKLAKGGLSPQETTKLKQQIADEKNAMAKEGISPDVITRLDGLSGDALNSMAENLGSDARAKAGFNATNDTAMSQAAMIANKAGLGSLASQMSGGIGNVDAVMSAIASMGSKDRDALRANGGDYLVDAAMLNSKSSDAEVSRVLNGAPVTANMRNEDGTINLSAVRELAVRQSSAIDSNRAVVGSNAFTPDQTAQQLEVIAKVQQLGSQVERLTKMIDNIKKD